jgi:type III pantothenate kinase
VPPLDEIFKDAVAAVTGVKALVACVDIGVDMPVLIDNPAEVGSDRLINAYAAYQARSSPLIVVDFGTATTFDYITRDGEFAGGVIAPGLAISAEALFEKAAKLPRAEFEKPARVIGKNTIQSMQSGFYYGYASLADGIIDRMICEAGCEPFVMATGGLSKLIGPEVKRIDATDEFLTLKGLRLIYEGTDDDN